MPLASLVWVGSPRRWGARWRLLGLGLVVESVVVVLVLEWHSRLAGSIGVLCVTAPMMLAAGPVPPMGVLVAGWGSFVFVLVASTQTFGVPGVNEAATIVVWVASTYLVATLTGRLRRSRDAAVQHVVRAEGEERRRIAEDLHDDSVQIIVASLLQIDQLDESETRSETQRSLRMALDRLRTLTFVLRPPDLSSGGLQAALPQLCEAYRPQLAARSCHLSYHVDLRDARYAPLVEELAHRVALEALQNALKHSHAENVSVTASSSPYQLRVLVTDDGRGFTPQLARRSGAAPWEHLGLQAKIDRVAWAGGTLRVQSVPGRGTTVHLTLPTRV